MGGGIAVAIVAALLTLLGAARLPEGVAPRVPNIAHWAWRSGDADWTMALSVVMARVVQRAETLYLHTGPLGDGDWS